MAGSVAVQGDLQPAPALGIGCHGVSVIPQLRCGNQSAQGGQSVPGFRRIKFTAHGADIGDGASQIFRGQREGEGVPRLQQDGLCLHQPLPDGTVRGLTHITALGVLQVCLAHQQRNLQIRDGRAGENAPVRLFRHVGQNQALIAGVQNVGGADGVKNQPAPPAQRFQQHMNLGIVAQRLEMSDAFHPIFDGFLVEDLPIVQRHIHPESLLHQRAENFQLHPAHDLHVNPAALPENVELGIFFLQLPQLGQCGGGIGAGRKLHPVGHHRLQNRRPAARFHTEALPGEGAGQPRHSAQRPGRHFLRRSEFVCGIKPKLDNLFLAFFPFLRCITQCLTHLQRAARDFQPGQADALGVTGDFVYPGGKRIRPASHRRAGIQYTQQLLHALQLQRGAEAAGKYLPGCDQAPEIARRHRTGFQIGFQQRLVAQGSAFGDFSGIGAEIHTSAAEFPLKLGQKPVPVRAGKIHFVDKQKGGDSVPLQ